ncbi:uncharacterized protein LOC113279150 [Papaver somniferum]|uniref:uncharacterized protein LOC113279150 n=1 Tax=Papaver somniferum TaxID=3469 RepID=UPI000E705027|nr:uncharacterized protein LOC113279150 [Papaver somniferum]
MGSALGRPIRVDETTLKKEIGYYASILVEIDLTKAIPNKVWVESKYGTSQSEIPLTYEVEEGKVIIPSVGQSKFQKEVVDSQLDKSTQNDVGFTGILNSLKDFPSLSVEKLIDIGTSIPPLNQDADKVIIPFTIEESVEALTAEVLSNINSCDEDNLGWKEDQAFFKVISKPVKGKSIKDSDADPENIELLNNLITARGKHELASQQYNEMMRNKYRIKWVKEGGSNTTFFHANMRIRRAQNNIAEVENDEGNLKKFKSRNVVFDEDLLATIPKILNEEDNILLDALSSLAEIKNAVFEMNANSALGPDGFPGSLYKFAWEIIGAELVEDIQYCWRNNFIPKGFNSNFLFLFPKIQGENRAEHFRPIGLANFNFKIITRIITTRISTMIDKMVSVQQSAFIKGRNIHEKIVLASELVNELDIKRRGVNVGLKIDITQAFDSISWNFLFEVLKRFGFSVRSINWLRKIFESAKISVLVNGGPCGFFEVRRGLRQGDPLSPILFVLVEEVLSRNISKLVQIGKIQAMVNRDGC